MQKKDITDKLEQGKGHICMGDLFMKNFGFYLTEIRKNNSHVLTEMYMGGFTIAMPTNFFWYY